METAGSKARTVPDQPLFIRRLGELSVEMMGLFARLEEAVSPRIADGQTGHRIKAIGEMYVSVAEASWISQAAQKLHIAPTNLRGNLKARLPSTAHRPQEVHLAEQVVRRAGRDGITPVGQSPGGYSRLELVMEGAEVMSDLLVSRAWANRKGLRVPPVGSLTMNLLAPTEILYPGHVLAGAANAVEEIMPQGTVIPLGPVVPYSDFFDASGGLLPSQNPPT